MSDEEKSPAARRPVRGGVGPWTPPSATGTMTISEAEVGADGEVKVIERVPVAVARLCLIAINRSEGYARSEGYVDVEPADIWLFAPAKGAGEQQQSTRVLLVLASSVGETEGWPADVSSFVTPPPTGLELTAATPELFRELKRLVGQPPPKGLRLIPPSTSDGGVRERPATFAPAALTIMSDPHTMAGIRGMWAPHEWKHPPDGRAYYQDANGVMVYARDAGDVVLALDDNRVSAFVICMGKWYAETGGELARPEAARIHVDDVLGYRGIKKHPKGGYQPKQKEAAKEDILFLRDLWVRSHQQVWEATRRGKRQLVDVDVDDPLVEVSVESTVDFWGERTPYAFRFRPGPWARHYLGGPQHWTTAVLKQIMSYHPYTDRLKMRLGLYLTFQWRIRANRGTLAQPWKLKTLLEGAKIEIPKKDPQRFFPRVLKDLEELHTDGVLASCEALDFPDWHPPADEPPKRWVPKLLEGRWRLLPVAELRDRLPHPERTADAR